MGSSGYIIRLRTIWYLAKYFQFMEKNANKLTFRFLYISSFVRAEHICSNNFLEVGFVSKRYFDLHDWDQHDWLCCGVAASDGEVQEPGHYGGRHGQEGGHARPQGNVELRSRLWIRNDIPNQSCGSGWDLDSLGSLDPYSDPDSQSEKFIYFLFLKVLDVLF
jgi:hypothetical protein